MSDPSAIVQQQVDGYNARDLDTFCAAYDREIELFSFPDKVLVSGIDPLRERYRQRFEQNPDLRAEIHQRLTLGEFVYDLETASGADFGCVRAMVIYQVENGLIRRVWVQA